MYFHWTSLLYPYVFIGRVIKDFMIQGGDFVNVSTWTSSAAWLTLLFVSLFAFMASIKATENSHSQSSLIFFKMAITGRPFYFYI